MGVTMRELAKMAGVSPATISLALRDHPRISLTVRERIKALAKEVGYRPNPVVAQLISQVRASKTTTYQSTIGAILTAEHREYLKVHTFRDWLAGCKERATLLGYGFDIFNLHDSDLSPERLVKILDARRIQALVVPGPFQGASIPGWGLKSCLIGKAASDPSQGSSVPVRFDVLWRRYAVVLMGERPVEPNLSCVLNNQFSTSILAANEFKRLGYLRPAICIHPDIDEVLENRFIGGFLIAQKEIPERERVPPFYFRPDAALRFKQWMARYRPDAIMTLHHEIKDWLEVDGFAVPGDVGLAHLDWTPKLTGWAGTDQNNAQVASVAIDMLIGQLHRNEFGYPPFQKCMFINSTWKNGSTVIQI